MNSTTPYEQAIAQKLNSLPVPDMADSIWSRIETLLDAPIEPDNKPTQAKPNNGLWYGVIGVAIVAITIALYYNNQRNTTAAPSVMPIPIKNIVPIIDSGAAAPHQAAPANKAVPSPAPAKKDTIANVPPVARIDFDALNKVSTAPPPPDPSTLNSNQLPVLQVKPLQTNTPISNSKGVKGITENDYRILSSKKDSIKKGS